MTYVVCYQDDTPSHVSTRKVNLDGEIPNLKLTGNDIVMILLGLKLWEQLSLKVTNKDQQTNIVKNTYKIKVTAYVYDKCLKISI